jgi:hypothetical protein
MTKETINAAAALVKAIQSNKQYHEDKYGNTLTTVNVQYIADELEELENCLKHWKDIIEPDNQPFLQG